MSAIADPTARAGTARGELPAAPAHHRGAAEPAPGVAARIALLGASGYAGQELVRLAIGHPGIELKALFSREHAGRPAAEVLPGLDPRLHLPSLSDPATLGELLAEASVDVLVSALPHGALRALLAENAAPALRQVRLVDLSSDHRDGRDGHVYGLPEAFRREIAGALRVANPGCYPTAAALALLPAAEAGWLDGPVMVSALSGVSGAGRAAVLRTSFVELEGGTALYRAGIEHPHVPEMARTLERLTGRAFEVGFAPQLAPMARGILLTATAPLARRVEPEEAQAACARRFATEPFVRALDSGRWPETRAVRGSNRCDVRVTTIHGGRTLLATAALDNLVKGAAGQAIQNLNLMLGWPESCGLPANGTPW